MKIVYGVCGEGLGHASRSRILIHYLLDKGHDISIVAGGKAYPNLSQFFDQVIKVEWPEVVYTDNAMKITHSILRIGYRTLVGSIPSFFKVKKLIKKFRPDLLITDGEPISFYAGRTSRLKCMSIDNPQALLYRSYPVTYREIIPWMIFTIALKLSTFHADKYIIYDFSPSQIQHSNVIFMKPLIQSGILQHTPTYGKHIFVYQTSTSNNELFAVLKKIKEQFIIYGFNIERTTGNLMFKKFNEKDFYRDIATAKAVITNAGFTVLSEALYLKKPIFSIPIRSQFEQVVNGKFIMQLGVGVSVHKASEENLMQFLSHLQNFQEKLQTYDSGNQEKILERIFQEITNLFELTHNKQ
jgi:uncharacterized protein (TIGR00661 family)